jgi:hypothetical protein
MAGWRDSLVLRANRYIERRGRTIRHELGFGIDGIVFSPTCQSAIKVLRYEPLYVRERDVYLRLQESCVTNIKGFDVPYMTDYDDELWVVEMSIVSPPFVLDFAGAYLDRAPDFPDEIMEDWRAEKLAFEVRPSNGCAIRAVGVSARKRLTCNRHDWPI